MVHFYDFYRAISWLSSSNAISDRSLKKQAAVIYTFVECFIVYIFLLVKCILIDSIIHNICYSFHLASVWVLKITRAIEFKNKT